MQNNYAKMIYGTRAGGAAEGRRTGGKRERERRREARERVAAKVELQRDWKMKQEMGTAQSDEGNGRERRARER